MILKFFPRAALWFSISIVFSACASGGKIHVVQDPFVGEQKGFVLYLDFGGFSAFNVVTAQGKYTMKVLVPKNGQIYDSVVANRDKAAFRIGDEIVILANEVTNAPVHGANQYTVFTQWELTFHMNREQAARFAKAPLKAIKANIASHEFTITISDSHGEKIQSNMAELTQ
jgi:hypothetical protein